MGKMNFDFNIGINQRGQRASEQTKKIIERLKNGESGSALAREYGISRQAVSQIKLKYVIKKEKWL